MNENTQKTYDTHVFICTQCSYQTETGACSDPGKAAEFRKNLKSMAKSELPDKKIRINASGCLGQCELGIASVIYPQQDWHVGLRPGDEIKILELLKKS